MSDTPVPQGSPPHTPTGARMDPSSSFRARTVFAAACTGMLFFGMTTVSLGTINAYLASKFSLDEIAVGSLAALLPLGILCGSVIFGPVVDRYGYRFPLSVSSLFLLAGFEMIAFADSFAPVQAAFFLLGFGGGVINGGTSALVADTSEGSTGAALSLLGVFFGIGALGLPALTGFALTRISYETIISLLGLSVLLPVTVFLSVALPSPKQPMGFPLKEGGAMLKHPTLLLLAGTLFFQSGLEGMTSSWSTMYLQKIVDLPVEISLFGLTAYAASLTAARGVLGWLLKRFSPATVAVSCMAVAIAGGVLLMYSDGPTVSFCALALIGIGFAPVFPVVLGYVAELFPTLSGTAFGIALVVALIGSTILNYLLGILTESSGLSMYPIAHLVCVAALIFLFVVAIRTHPRRSQV